MDDETQILNALEPLIGSWNSSGNMLGENAQQITIVGTDTYEWLPGKQFMIHKASVMVGEDKVDVIEIIGEYDEAQKACAMHAFQNDGSHGVMWASVNTDGSLLFTGDTIRATLTINLEDNTMDATWERLDNNQWQHWMDMHFEKD